MRKLFALCSIIVFCNSSCVEEYDLYRDEIFPRLVVDGLITNKPGPYYVRLTKSQIGTFEKPLTGQFEWPYDNAEAVKGAQIIISDDINQIDTLIPVNVDPDYIHPGQFRYYKLEYDEEGNFVDTLFLEDPSGFNYDRGFYKTQNLIGIPGRTYHMKILSEGKIYEATTFMPPVPEIDSVGFVKMIGNKEDPVTYPLLYFSEPRDTVNYYLIQLQFDDIMRALNINTLWKFSVLSDEFIQSYVNGLKVSIGATPRNNEYHGVHSGMPFYIALSSLTKDGYEFYKSLLQQFNNDGGAYHPSPASPPTNISNDALGYFRASAISEKKLVVPKINKIVMPM